MGQSASTERQLQLRPSAPPIRTSTRTSPQYEVLQDTQASEIQEQERPSSARDGRWASFRYGAAGLSRLTSARPRQPEYHSTYRRETRARSSLISERPDDPETHGRDDVVLEQEERPLILREIRLNNAPIVNIQAGPMPRRPSMLARLGSRVVSRGPQRIANPTVNHAGEEQLTEQSGQSDVRPIQQTSNVPQSRRNRFSMFDLPTVPVDSANAAPRRNSLADINFAPSADSINAADSRGLTEVPGNSRPTSRRQNLSTPERPSRASRFRRTLTTPIETLFSRGQTRPQRGRNMSYNRPQAGADETRNLISPQGTGTTVQGTSAALLDPEASASHVNDAEEGTEANPVELDSPDRPTSWHTSSRGSENQTDSRRSSRRIQQLLGGRSSRLIRREDDTPLSRVLQLAAAAIAAQLSGTSDASPDLQSVGDDHFDGNLNAFIQSLNTAAEQSVNEEMNPASANLPPLNFWRVFRFVNNQSRDAVSGLNQHPPTLEDGMPGRLVTLVVVGVRSVPSSSVMGDSTGPLNTHLDGLLALPTTPPEGLHLGQALQPQPSSSRNRLQRRRTSLTGAGTSGARYESQRHQGTPGTRLSRTTGLNPLRRTTTSGSSAGIQARPPSPFPIDHSVQLPDSGLAIDDAEATIPPYNASRPAPRRRSESHGHLGSGAARRNGVVEPDRDSSASETAPPNGRHWLIYVVGTNLSEDHPAFQAPSLFTDNPSYEDMVMLSTLLGPVKPPVASAEDMAAARGVFRLEIRRADGSWMARAIDNVPGHGVASSLEVISAEAVKCLVCQDEFTSGDEVRQLQKCKHVYHRLCVDEWLTTGRNSCPMCRTPGVEESQQPQSVPAV